VLTSLRFFIVFSRTFGHTPVCPGTLAPGLPPVLPLANLARLVTRPPPGCLRLGQLALRGCSLPLPEGTEQVVAASVLAGSGRRQLQNAVHPPERLPVVRHDQQPAGPPFEHADQPAPALEVQVVGGLVEDEQIRSVEQRPGERHPGRLAPAHVAHRAGQGEVAEPQARQPGLRALGQVPPVGAHPVQVGRVAPSGQHPLQGVEPLPQTHAVGDGFTGVQGAAPAALPDVRDAARAGDGALGRWTRAREDVEEERLADAVRADQPRPFAAEREGEVAEEPATVRKGQTEPVCR
jgi:hypothetical protein